MSTISDESITDLASHLNTLLQTKEKALQEKEADFARRVKLFESENPNTGNDNDIIQLNVGGRINISVLRRTLTQFPDSMLAAKFSGRWDDTMEKDRDGNIFIDQNPDNFSILINYLRMRMNSQNKHVPVRHVPEVSYSFCSMLDYYGLMPALYPQKWIGNNDNDFSCEEVKYGTYELSTDTNASVLCDFGQFSSVGVSEFTVEFETGTIQGAVGWIFTEDSVHSHPLNEAVPNSIFYNLAERKLYGTDNILQENVSATTIICRRRGKKEYSVELVNASPTNDGAATATVEEEISSRDYSTLCVLPMISFTGKVTVSNLKYAIDELDETGYTREYKERYMGAI